MDNFLEEKKDFEELLTYSPFERKEDFYFYSQNIKEITTILKNILLSKNGCGAIIGEKGTGKTTFIHRFINEYLKDVEYIYIIGSSLSQDELFKEIMEYFADEKINPDIPIKEKDFFKELKRFLEDLKKKKQRLFLILDDAQNFPDETLDIVEKICKISIDGEKAVSVILLGNKQLEKKLNSTRHKDLRYQLKFFLYLQNLTEDEVENFVKEFLLEKGINIKISKPVISLIFYGTKGNLEILSRFMESLVETINTSNLNKIDKKIVYSIFDQLGIEIPQEKRKIPVFVILIVFGLFLIGVYFLLFPEKEQKKTENLQEIVKKEKEKPLVLEKKPEPPEILEEKSEQKEKNEPKVQNIPEKSNVEEEKVLKNLPAKKETKELPEKETSAKNEIRVEEKNLLSEKIKTEEKDFNEIPSSIENELSKVSQKIYENYKKAVVLTKTLSLRKGPGTNYKKILDLLKNESVIVVDDSKGKWAKVIYRKDGQDIEGWVYKKFIKEIPEGKALVTAPFLSIREKPSSKSKRIGKIPKGELVDLLGEKKGIWVKIRYKEDNKEIEGWVSKYFLAY